MAELRNGGSGGTTDESQPVEDDDQEAPDDGPKITSGEEELSLEEADRRAAEQDQPRQQEPEPSRRDEPTEDDSDLSPEAREARISGIASASEEISRLRQRASARLSGAAASAAEAERLREKRQARISGAASASAERARLARREQSTENLSEAVESIEEKTGIDFPDSQLAPEDIGADRDFGGVDIMVRRGPEDEFVTAEDAVEMLEADFEEATQIQEPAVTAAGEPDRGRAGEGLRQEQREFTGAGRDPVAQFSQGAIRSPTLVTSGAVFLKDAVEFQAEVTMAALRGDEERLKELGSDAASAARESAVLIGETAAKDPGKFTATNFGTLVASGFIFGGARALGPKTSGVARATIQPGEEVAGIGGFAVTKRLAGQRTAQRLFPNKEPLIFSEEAVIRRAAAAAGATSRATSRATRRARIEAKAARFKVAEVRNPDVETRLFTKEDRGQVTMAPPRLRTRAVETEVESEAEPTTEPRGIFGFDVETEAESRATAEVDTEAEQRRRLAETAVGTEQLSDIRTDQRQRQDVEQDIDFDIDQDFETDIETDTEQEQDVEQEFEFEQEQEQEFESEFESEFEFETEPFGPRRQRRPRGDSLSKDEEFEKTFVSRVADPTEVIGPGGGRGGSLSGLSEDVLDDS